jgi:hypothetical protein
MHWWLDIEELDGTKAGPGPLRSATSFEVTRRLDAAGKFKAKGSLSETRASMVQAKRRVRAWGLVDGTATDLGAGIIDKIGVDVDLKLDLSGDDLLRELTYRQVGTLTIGTEVTPSVTGPAQIAALFPTGWSLDVVNGHNATLKAIHHVYEGESCLAALCKLAEITGEHFRLGTGRTVIWMQADRPVSGVRAIQGGDPIALESNINVCLIIELQEEQDSYDCLIGRVYAYGVGNGNARITLAGISIGVTGWTVGSDSKGYYLQHTATWSAYGIERYISFKDQSDANTLLEAAYEWMLRRLALQQSYKISIAKLDRELSVGSSLRVIYRRVLDGMKVLDIDANLVVLESTVRVDAQGIHTTAIKVATIDVWPDNDASASMSGMNTSRDNYSYPQPGEVAAHHTSHEEGGSDEIKLDDLATPDNNTDLNASAARHGLLLALSGVSTDVLLGDGTWGAGGGGGVSGSGVANQVALWAASTTLSGNTGLTYDPATDALLNLGTVTAKPTGTAGIRLDPNAATGNFVVSLSPGTTQLTANRRVSFPNADLIFSSGGTIVLAGYTLTVSATGSVAFLNVANTFNKINLIQPTTSSAGAFAVKDQNGLPVFDVDTTNRRVAVGDRSFPTYPLDVTYDTDALWLSGAVTVTRFARNCGDYPSAGFGSILYATLGTYVYDDRSAGTIEFSWVDATDATRKARARFTVYDTAEREAIRIEASGSAAMIGLLGANASARSTGWAVSNVTSDKVFDADATSMDELADVLGTLITELITKGLLGA